MSQSTFMSTGRDDESGTTAHTTFSWMVSSGSVIAVVSSGRVFLEAARGVLAPAIGSRHEFQRVLVTTDGKRNSAADDLIFCDSIAIQRVRSPKAIHYRLLQQTSIGYVEAAMKSYCLLSAVTVCVVYHASP
jgi:hypothetical protein